VPQRVGRATPGTGISSCQALRATGAPGFRQLERRTFSRGSRRTASNPRDARATRGSRSP
jgi:hypothetical protein